MHFMACFTMWLKFSAPLTLHRECRVQICTQMVRAIEKDGQGVAGIVWPGQERGTGELTIVILKVEGQKATSTILNIGNSALTLRTFFLPSRGQSVGGSSERSCVSLSTEMLDPQLNMVLSNLFSLALLYTGSRAR